MVERFSRRGSSLATCAVALVGMSLAFGLLTLGCGDDEPVEQDPTATPRPEGPATPTPDPHAPDPDPRFDAEGNLLESEEVVFGVKLPIGCEATITDERRHVYQSMTKVDKVLSYFGPRLLTGQVERLGAGAVYRGAQIHGSEASGRVDVSITPTQTGSRIEIVKLVQPSELPPETRSEEEIRRTLERDLQRLD